MVGFRPDQDRVPLMRQPRMKHGLAHDWWTIGLRGLAALLFATILLLVPLPARASLALLFAAYIAADGALALMAGMRAARRGQPARGLVLEGSFNIAAAAAVLAWPAAAILPFVRLASAWAIITGALLIAAARRLPGPHGHPLLALAGLISCGWGLSAIAADAHDLQGFGWWLIAYAVLFGGTLLLLSLQLLRRQWSVGD